MRQRNYTKLLLVVLMCRDHSGERERERDEHKLCLVGLMFSDHSEQKDNNTKFCLVGLNQSGEKDNYTELCLVDRKSWYKWRSLGRVVRSRLTPRSF
jgi:hypothetical protein